MLTITFFNNKGGVGKTSLVHHLAWMLSRMGRRVLAVDLDPQANLTAAFLREDAIEDLWCRDREDKGGATVFQCVKPLTEMGDILSPTTIEITPDLHLLPGDLSLSRYEGSLSHYWAQSLERAEVRPFRVVASLWEICYQGAERCEADLVLIDVGPNLGAINRSALIASDYVVVPLIADLFSLQGLRNLGPTLRGWRAAWLSRSENWESRKFSLPGGSMLPLGYVLQQNGYWQHRPVAASKRWAEKIPLVYREAFLGVESQARESIGPDPFCIAQVKNYRSLAPMAQEVRKPIFDLTSADGALGTHAEAVRDARKGYEALATEILRRIGKGAANTVAAPSP